MGRARDQGEQRVEAARAGIEQRQPIAIDREGRLGSGRIHRARLCPSVRRVASKGETL